MEGRPPPTLTAPPPHHPATPQRAGSSPPPYSLKAPTGRSGLWLLHPLHPWTSEPSADPLSLPGPRARLRSLLGSQPWARVGSSRGLPPGRRREAGRAGMAVASAASSWLCHEGEKAKPGAFQGRDWESGAERRLEGSGRGWSSGACPARPRPLGTGCSSPSPRERAPRRRQRGGRAGEARAEFGNTPEPCGDTGTRGA